MRDGRDGRTRRNYCEHFENFGYPAKIRKEIDHSGVVALLIYTCLGLSILTTETLKGKVDLIVSESNVLLSSVCHIKYFHSAIYSVGFVFLLGDHNQLL